MSSAPQLDFAVWLLDVGTFGIQTKGGRYIMIDGEWHLVTDRGQIRKESPIPGTWDPVMASRYLGPAVATLGTSTMAEGGLPKWLASSRSGAVIHVDADAGGERAARQLRRRIHAAAVS